jgi:hypothetical protein
MLRFYTNTHTAKAIATQLKERGVDIIRCEDVGLAEVTDFQHLAYAAEHKRTIVTNVEVSLNRDFACPLWTLDTFQKPVIHC